MYFLPLLLGLVSFLLYPSLLLAIAISLGVWAFLALAGEPVSAAKRNNARGQLAFRILLVKLSTLNGEMTDTTYEVHALLTPDDAETSELRSDLRNAAFTTGADWKYWARQVRRIYNSDPVTILDRYEKLIVQLSSSAGGITEESQDRLIEIGKMWGVGPNKAREFIVGMNGTPSTRMAAW